MDGTRGKAQLFKARVNNAWYPILGQKHPIFSLKIYDMKIDANLCTGPAFWGYSDKYIKCKKCLKMATLGLKMAILDFKMAILGLKMVILDFKMAMDLFENIFIWTG